MTKSELKFHQDISDSAYFQKKEGDFDKLVMQGRAGSVGINDGFLNPSQFKSSLKTPVGERSFSVGSD